MEVLRKILSHENRLVYEDFIQAKFAEENVNSKLFFFRKGCLAENAIAVCLLVDISITLMSSINKTFIDILITCLSYKR